MQHIRKLLKQTQGVTSIEYAFIAGLIALGMLLGLYSLKSGIQYRYNNMSDEVNKDR